MEIHVYTYIPSSDLEGSLGDEHTYTRAAADGEAAETLLLLAREAHQLITAIGELQSCPLSVLVCFHSRWVRSGCAIIRCSVLDTNPYS